MPDNDALTDFEALFASAPCALVALDPELSVLAVSDAYLKLAGRSREALLGAGCDALWVPCAAESPQRHELRSSLERARRTLASDAVELCARELSGAELRIRHFRITSEPVRGRAGALAHVIQRVEDISELAALRAGEAERRRLHEHFERRGEQIAATIERSREAQRALLDSEERYRIVVRAASDGVFDVDLQSGAVWCSERLLESLGYHEEQFTGTMAWIAANVFHPDDRRRGAGELQTLLADTGAAEHSRALLRLRHASGDWRTAVIRASVQRDERGRALRMLGTVSDVTERQRAEAQRVALARELHDSVVQDLASAKTYAATARKAAAQRPELVAEVLDVLTEQLSSAEDNMRLIIRALRSDTTLLEARGSVSALAKTLVGELRRRAPQLDVTLTDTLAEGLEAGPVAAATFGHVLREALLNVLEHSCAVRVAVSVSAHAGMLRLEVSDDGRGFDCERAPDGHFGVVGMRERALAAAGSFEVSSTPGRGTRIVMELPQPFLAPPSTHRMSPARVLA